MNNKDDLAKLKYKDYIEDYIEDVDITTFNALQLLRKTNSVILKNYGSILFWVVINVMLIFITFVLVTFMPQETYVMEITKSDLMFISFFVATSMLCYYLYFRTIAEFRTNVLYIEKQKVVNTWLSLVLNFIGFMVLVACFSLICYGLYFEYSKLDAYINGLNLTSGNFYEFEALIFAIVILLAGLYIAVCRLLIKLVMFEVFAKGNKILKAFKTVLKTILHNKNNILVKIFIGSFIVEIVCNVVFGVLVWILDYFTLSSSIMLPGIFFILLIYICFLLYEIYAGAFVYLTYMSADVE